MQMYKRDEMSSTIGVCVCVCLTAFAVHICVALAGQHSVFVGDGVQQNGNGDERVTAVCYPGNTFGPALTLLLHQL